MKLLPVLSTFALLSASASASNFFQQLAGAQQPLGGTTGTKVPGESPLEFCSENLSADVLTIEKVDLLPNPPQPGKTLTIEGVGVLHDAVAEGAYVNLVVKYGLITLIRQTLDLCENAGEVDMECPIDQGKVIIHKSVDIPSAVPPGKYTVTATVSTADDRPITCLTGQIVFTN